MARIKTDRNIIVYVLLTMVTFGIYGLFFIHQLAKDVNVMCYGDGQETAGLGKYIILSIVTCGIYSIVWWYKLANRLQVSAPRYGIVISENGNNFLLWYFLGMFVCSFLVFYAMHLVFNNTNKLATAFNAMYNLG